MLCTVFDTSLLDYYQEIKGDLNSAFHASSSHVNLFHNITTSARVRLALTERLILKTRS